MRRFSCAKLLAMLLCVLMLPVGVRAEENGSAKDLFPAATVTVKETDAVPRLSDGNANSYVSFKAGEELAFSTGERIAGLYLSWHGLPGAFTLEWLNASGAAISSERPEPFSVNEFRAAPDACFGARFVFDGNAGISEIRAFGEGALPDSIQRWEPPAAEPALMLVCGYPGDELLFFGALVPYLIDRGVPFAIAYMSAYSRERQEEGLSALWALGYRTYPVFLGVETGRNREVKYLRENWKKSDAAVRLSAMLLAYRPKAIVSFAPDGEPDYLFAYPDPDNKKITRRHGEAQTAVTGVLVAEAIDYAEAKRGFHAEQYLVKGLGGGTEQDVNVPLGRYGGQTGTEVAQAVYDAYFDSLRTFGYTVESRADYRAVIGGERLLEQIGYTPLYTPVPLPTPTPEPTPEPTEAPSEAPSAVPTHEPQPDGRPENGDTPAPASGTDRGAIFLYAGIGLLALLAALVFVLKRTALKKTPLWAMILTAVLVLAAYAGAAYLILRGAAGAEKQASEAIAAPSVPTSAPPTAAQTPERIETVTAAPTAAPTPEPTEEPTVTPGRFREELFTAPGEPERIVADAENGVWSYHSSTLSIEIRRHTTEEPLVWFAAEIYMRDSDEFRPLFGNEGRSGRTPLTPWKLARLNQAVLILTGDNLIHMEAEKKGTIIRDGKTFNTRTDHSAMAWDHKNRSMVLFPKGTYTAKGLLESGYENTFAFGPILLMNGEKQQREIEQSGVYVENPRCGIGMVEPGHFIAIVVDGRRPKYSVGVNLDRFADMFLEYGCTDAFNMDGGVSACMIFMGEQLNLHGDVVNKSSQRHMPDALGFGYSRLVPTINDPIHNDGIDRTGKYK